MPLRAGTLLLLPFLVCSFASYAAPTASPASQLIVEAIPGGPPLNGVGADQWTTPGSPSSFFEVLPAAGGTPMLITTDRAQSGQGAVLLPLLAMLILLFGLMALPGDPRYAWRRGWELSKKAQRLEVR